jgi:tetratricopeptide (TPR) repeat protein
MFLAQLSIPLKWQLSVQVVMMKATSSPRVSVRREAVVIPTYNTLPPDKNPMFLEKRVYQGSSGKVYPLPFFDRISEFSEERSWDAVHLENQFLKVMILPEIGGRIHIGQDKTNGYDFFYRQNVIKPALVGLAGPWISGGVEFNWPQHHRPATFMPVDVEIEHHADGSVTVWCSDHDPMARMKGMHGVCLHPEKASIELKVRAYNRTSFVQTFLWWANVATKVNESYQSFFPPDVHYVADHARRSMSEYPLCHDHYYGVDYGKRAKTGVPQDEIPLDFVPPNCGGSAPVSYPANDLSFYANIPVPTSYMCMGSKEDFFGGYDHAAQAGVVHVANHHIAPGKKQWTWGNHEFGYAWDRSLTESDGPYIEIMAGVYTDNQPDFSFLMPGETKSWSQYWYPIQKIGPASHANTKAAISLHLAEGVAHLGASVTERFKGATISLAARGKKFSEITRDLAPGNALVTKIKIPKGVSAADLTLSVCDSIGREIISYAPKKLEKSPVPPPATEPPQPGEILSTDELYITGLHLEQYRHATRSPEAYWREALRRDPGDTRCNNALGLWHLRRGEFAGAEKHFRQAIERQTLRNANPYDGEPLYNLGQTLRYLGREEEAYDAFYKSVWNQAWQSAGYHQLAELDCRKGDWSAALTHLDFSLRLNTDNLRARNLRVMVLRKLHRADEAKALLKSTRALDPLDWWSLLLEGGGIHCDTQIRFDLALDHASAGFYAEALSIIESARADVGTAPLIGYYAGWIYAQMGEGKKSVAAFRKAAKESPDYCFPSRLEEILILEAAMQAHPKDPRSPYYLGNLFYDKRRHAEAIHLWERSAKLDPRFSVVWRNLGIGYFNISRKPAKAREAYETAFRLNSDDARLLYERDQLWKRLGVAPAKRLGELEKHLALVGRRDDLSVEICSLYNQTGQPEKAHAILSGRKFQPWEGGEGQALGQHVRTQLAMGRKALASDLPSAAVEHFRHALSSPRHLAEAKHLLANQSDIHYWLGMALERAGEKAAARVHWKIAAEFRGDFQEMSVRAFSEMTYYSALALEKLGQQAKAARLLRDLLAYAKQVQETEAKIDYFATSLPTMLLFDEDLQFRQETGALFLQAQVLLGLGKKASAHRLLATILTRDPNHAFAADLAS